MKLMGLIGGMSWKSTQDYYRIINELVSRRLGGLHSARILLHSVDFAPVEEIQSAGDRERAAEYLGDIARTLAAGGADFLAICCNTMHVVADEVEAAAGIPLVHIVDATARAITAAGLHTVGLLGTRFTMEQDFYRGRLEKRFGLEALIPDKSDRETVHRVIYDELCKDVVNGSSQRECVEIIGRLLKRGAEGIILGCTELPMLIRPEDTDAPLFDTTRIHAEALVEKALVED